MKRNKILIIIGVIVVFIVIGLFVPTDQLNSVDDSIKSMDSTSAAWQASADSANRAAHTWQYDSTTDDMTSKQVYTATINSTNTLEFTSASDNYNVSYRSYRLLGRTHIHARTHNYSHVSTAQPRFIIIKKDGKTLAELSIKGGTFAPSRDFVRIRFDQDQPRTFPIKVSSDGSNSLFIENASPLITSLKHASNIIIEAEYADDGIEEMKFKVDNFVWNH